MDGKLVFEGEYINGKLWKGKLKSYIKDILIFEGDILNGKKDGKIKEYYKDNGLLLFEGEYINGKKWNGKIYNKDGKFEFEIINGKGKVKEYIFGWLMFEGEYLNGEKNGKG